MTNPRFSTSRKKNIKFPSRNRGRSQHYLLGGIHMTSYGYLPFALLKLITCTECNDEFHDIPNKLEKASKGGYFGNKNGWRHFEQQQQLIVPKHNRPGSDNNRIVLLKDAIKQDDGSLQSTYYIPWFLKCNPKRYPSWFLPFQSDPRIV